MVPLLRGESPAQVACTIALCDQLAHGWTSRKQPVSSSTSTLTLWTPRGLHAGEHGPGGTRRGQAVPGGRRHFRERAKLERLMAFMGRQAMTH